MSNGDQTKLGEMGHSLSGGQKSRISLARAIYRRDATVLLIDSTLSSLDAQVCHSVFENAITGLCRDKLVLMVTYDLYQAAKMDKVLYIHDTRATLMDQTEFIESEIYKKRLQLKPVEKESDKIEAVDDLKAISQKIETEEIEED